MKQYIQQRLSDIAMGKLPAGYRRSKLGVIPQTWETPELKTVLTENKDRNLDGRFSREDVLSVSGEVGVTNQIELLGRSFAGESVLDYHAVDHGDVVYTKSPLKANPYGIIKQNKGASGIVSTLYAVYHPCDYDTGTYLDYYFSLDRNVNNYLFPLVHKGPKNSLEVRNDEVLLGQIIFPSANERRDILKILECCDKVIRLKRELLAEKKKQKKSLMQKLLNPDSGFRLPGFSGAWNPCTIGEISVLMTGYPFESEAFSASGVKLLRCSNVKREKLDWSPAITERWQSTTGIEDFLLKAHDVVIAMDGALIGYSFAQIQEEDLPLLLVQRVARLRAKSCHPDFLKFLIINPCFGIYIDKVKTTTAIPHMSPQDILEYKIQIPTDLKEQEAIAKILSAADREINLLEQDLAQYEQKKKSLMQLLLTGKVRV